MNKGFSLNFIETLPTLENLDPPLVVCHDYHPDVLKGERYFTNSLIFLL